MASTLLGTAGGGLVINNLSNDYRWHVATAALGLGGVVAVAASLRRRPDTPINTWGIKAMLLLALIATVSAAVGPNSVAPWATGSAIALTLGAALVPLERGVAVALLGATAVIGTGTVMTTIGALLLFSGQAYLGSFGIAAGAPLFAFGMSLLTGRAGFAHIIALGVAITVAGLGLLGTDLMPAGIICSGIGSSVVLLGIAERARRYNLFGPAGICLAISGVFAGIELLSTGVLIGVLALVASLGTAGVALSFMMRNPNLYVISSVAIGAPMVVGGVSLGLFADVFLLFGVVVTMSGLAIIQRATVFLWEGSTGTRLRAWWKRANTRQAPTLASEEPRAQA